MVSVAWDKALRPLTTFELRQMGFDGISANENWMDYARPGGDFIDGMEKDPFTVFYMQDLMDPELANYGSEYVVIDPRVLEDKRYTLEHPNFEMMFGGPDSKFDQTRHRPCHDATVAERLGLHASYNQHPAND